MANVYVFQHVPGKGLQEVEVIDTEKRPYFTTGDILLQYPGWKLGGVSFVTGLIHVYLSKYDTWQPSQIKEKR